MHVFISHGEADRPWVSELAKSLRAEGIDVWLDASAVEPGKNWLREAARALERADAMILVKGTTLAVIMEPTGTCVCVLEGEVMVGARGESAGPEGSGGDAMMPVTSGQRGYVFRDGRTPERADIRPTELVALAKFRALQYDLLEQLTH